MESISHHIFLFPFTIDIKENTTNFLDDVEKSLLKAKWLSHPFIPSKKRTNYSEYFYFHPFARNAIFDKGEKTPEDQEQPIIKYYYQKTGKNACFRLFIKGKEEPYELTIKRISLRVYETQIGIMSFELENTRYKDIEDILLINDFGKRIYPQFLDKKDGVESPKYVFLANKVEFKIDDNTSYIEDFCETSFLKDHIVVANYIQQLLGQDFSTNKKEKTPYVYSPTIDDRMYVICWFGSNEFSRQLVPIISHNNHSYQYSDLWYRYIFHDGKSLNCKNFKMKQNLIKKATYERWAEYGTFYGISRYGWVCVTENFENNFIKLHMRKQYAQMAVLLLAQRASILRFSQRVSAISSEIKEMKSDKMKKISQKVSDLHAAYICFVNRMWFTEVSPQEQGIEMYEQAVQNMRLKEDMYDLKNEIKELHEYTSNALERETNSQMYILTILGALFLPLMLLTGFFGMNLSFINDNHILSLLPSFLKEDYGNICVSVISLVLFLTFILIIYNRIRAYINFLKEQDENILKHLKLKYFVFTPKKKT